MAKLKLNRLRSGSTHSSTGRGPSRPPTQPVDGAKNFIFLPERLFNLSRLDLKWTSIGPRPDLNQLNNRSGRKIKFFAPSIDWARGLLGPRPVEPGVDPDLDRLSWGSTRTSTGWAGGRPGPRSVELTVDRFLIQFNQLSHFWLNNQLFQLKTF